MTGGGGGPPVHWAAIGLGALAGVLVRALGLRMHYRHYPSFPSGFVTHMAMGFIASAIGAILVPGLAAKEYTAVSFLTLAATQFKDIRQEERQSLHQEEKMALVQRGPGYIEGIAKTFESRNYLSLFAATVVAGVTQFLPWWVGILTLAAVVLAALRFMRGETLGDLVEVVPATLRFEQGTLLYVDDVMMMEVGLAESRRKILEEGMGFVLRPRNPRGQAVLWDLDQRQAIAHDVAAIAGVQADVGYPELVPLVRMKMPDGDGSAGLVVVPVNPNPEAVIQAIRRVPVLESAKGHGVRSRYLRRKNEQPAGGNTHV